MKTNRKNLAKLAADLADDPAVEQGIHDLIERSSMVRLLTQYRMAKGLTQAQVAKGMGCDPSKVSRMESGYDDDLGWMDILKYLQATKTSVSLLFHDLDATIEDRTKQLVYAIHQNLEQLAEIARSYDGDDEAVEKINEFCGEVLLNFMIRFDQSYKKIQHVRPTANTEKRASLAASPE
ncbi:MAG TPA: transcriptional regulator [Kiritimatiellia bacterium]|nr:transcriptional regulator [Kiritimatiellia bacterium]